MQIRPYSLPTIGIEAPEPSGDGDTGVLQIGYRLDDLTIAHVFGRVVILVYGEDARVIRVLVVQFLEVSRIQGQNSPTGCLRMGEVDRVIFTGEWRVHVSRHLDVMASFEKQSFQFVGESTVIQV